MLPADAIVTAALNPVFSERFERKVDRSDSCHTWTGHRNPSGYGVVMLVREPRRLALAHRVAWTLRYGRIPDGLCVLHRCDNPPCVNIEHLWLGTVSDNIKDMDRKGRRRSVTKRGSDSGRALLTEDDVRLIRVMRPTHTLRRLAAAFGVSEPTISAIIAGRNWKHVT